MLSVFLSECLNIHSWDIALTVGLEVPGVGEVNKGVFSLCHRFCHLSRQLDMVPPPVSLGSVVSVQ